MRENAWHKRLNPRKRALIWGFPFRKKLPKKPLEKRKSELFSNKLQTLRKLSLFYRLPMKTKIQKVKPLLRAIKGRNINFLLYLEKRLDVILVRTSFCKHISQARQLIRHGNIYVNSEIVDIPGFVVSPGDLISIKEASKDLIRSNIAQHIERKKRIGESVKQLKRVRRPFLRPLLYPFIHQEILHRKFGNNSVLSGEAGERALLSERKIYVKKKRVLFHYSDPYFPRYSEVEYERLNAVVFADPPYNSIKYPYSGEMEKNCFL